MMRPGEGVEGSVPVQCPARPLAAGPPSRGLRSAGRGAPERCRDLVTPEASRPERWGSPEAMNH